VEDTGRAKMDTLPPSHKDAPVYDVDFYDDDFVRNPQPHYAAMRALGAVVWLSRHGNYAITRYNEVHAALRDHRIFSSRMASPPISSVAIS
jgi:cytochrome P450